MLSLLIAWGANLLAARTGTEKRTYGFRKITIIGSLASALLLLVALGGITWEAIGRLSNPKPVEGITVIVVASIGVVINTITALLCVSGQKDDLNIKGAFLHMAADAGVSFDVVAAGIIIMLTGWLLIDPLSASPLTIHSPVMLFEPNTNGFRGINKIVSEWGLRIPNTSSSVNQGEMEYVILGGLGRARDKDHTFPSPMLRQPWEAFEEVGFRCVRSATSLEK